MKTALWSIVLLALPAPFVGQSVCQQVTGQVIGCAAALVSRTSKDVSYISVESPQ